MKTLFFAWLAIFGYCVPAFADLPKIPFETLTGTFRQTKTLCDMDATLVSSGDFRVRKNRELFWRTLKPAETGFLLTPQGAYRIRGNEKTPLPDSALPLMQSLYAIFNAAFSGDEKTLGELFEIVREQRDSSLWILFAKKEPLASFLKKIELRASEDSLESVTLFDASGDVSVIEFSELKPDTRD